VHPTGAVEVTLEQPALVTVRVNGAPVRTFTLPAGRHEIRDLPLAAGLVPAVAALSLGLGIGANSLICTLGGGTAAGWFEAQYPKLLGTEANTSLVVGLCLVGGALAGIFDAYIDEAAAVGSGMIASTVSRTAEAYFQ
jgi:hypothetical protein